MGARSRYNSLTLCNYCGSGFISGRHQPWDLSENEQRNVQSIGWRRRARELLKTTQWLMLNGGLSGVPSISCFKESTQVSPELKESSGVSAPLSLCHGFFSRNESFHDKWRAEVHQKKRSAHEMCFWKSLEYFPLLTEIKIQKKPCTSATKTQIGLLWCLAPNRFRFRLLGAAFPRPHE